MSKSVPLINISELFPFCRSNDILNLKSNIHLVNDVNERDPILGWTLLSVSCYHHSYDCVRYLLDIGANINSVNFKGTSVLMYAKTKVIENRNFKFLDYLVEKGANPFIKDSYGKNILDYVKETTDNELISYFSKLINTSKIKNVN